MGWAAQTDRVLDELHPVEFQGRLYSTRSFGATVVGVRDTRAYSALVGMKSNVSPPDHSWYALTFPELDGSRSPSRAGYRGRIGEDLGRIAISHYLRYQEQLHEARWPSEQRVLPGLLSFSPIKNSDGEFSAEDLHLRTRNGYQVEVVKNGRPIAEYDGMFIYEATTGPGIIILESKTGEFTEFSARGPTAKRLLTRHFITPLRKLFPEYHIDVVLMSHYDRLFKEIGNGNHGDPEAAGDYERELKPAIRRLHHFFKEKGVGFIPATFPAGRDQMRDLVAKQHGAYRELRRLELPTHIRRGRHWLTTKSGQVVLMSGQRVEFFLDRVANDEFRARYIRPGNELGM